MMMQVHCHTFRVPNDPAVAAMYRGEILQICSASASRAASLLARYMSAISSGLSSIDSISCAGTLRALSAKSSELRP